MLAGGIAVSRSAKDTAATIFGKLGKYAADRGTSVPDGERYIFLDETEYDVLVASRRVAHLKFGRAQAAALIKAPAGEVLALAGFDAEGLARAERIREVDLSPGLVVAMLADLEVDPSVSPALVLNVVAAGSKDDAEYQGHDVADVMKLYPPLRMLEIDDDVAGTPNFHANVLAVCAKQGAHGNGWIEPDLAEELALLAEQRVAGLPYEFLTRAVLDLNPSNLFLALYRCLEATYAYAKATELASTLGIDGSWVDVARALGDTLSWYPRHDQSLAAVLAMPTVDATDLEALALAFGHDADSDTASIRVAMGLRELRNSLVHYGPTTRQVAIPSDWNGLCAPLARVVASVFAHAYATPAPAE
ncbi:hypothetical protein ACLILY_08105 [Mycobacterium sp. MS3]|uniref:hypothetical protein n=1 Tax=Mycobacterium sp. MS3 TaxID=3391378 RepID=UPI00398A29F8